MNDNEIESSIFVKPFFLLDLCVHIYVISNYAYVFNTIIFVNIQHNCIVTLSYSV